MKIQKGIVKYKNRSDIVCTYGLTDDGKQYYFLDETDTKKFANGNRVASTALVEAIDPMVKAQNVGVIDENGVVVIPFENRTIRPVNDTIILVEKAVPTSQSVIDANELRNDPAAATKLVSTPATIKSRLNAQMGVEGKYVFNDQFSEATLCDINGTNLIGGEGFSFISMANDKLYMSKNTADSPISEFSLTTYEMVATTPAEAIDISNVVVEQQVVEDALNAQGAAIPTDVQGMVPAEATSEVVQDAQDVVVPAEATSEAVQDAPLTPGVPMEAAAIPNPEEIEPVMEYNDDLSTVVPYTEMAAETAVAGTEAVNVPVAAEEAFASEAIAIPSDVVPTSEVATGEVAVSTEVPGEAVSVATAPEEVEPVMEYNDDLSTVVPYTEMQEGAPEGEFSAMDSSISDDLKAFTGGVPFAEDASEFDIPPIVEEEDKSDVIAEEAEVPAEETVAEEESTFEEAVSEEVEEEHLSQNIFEDVEAEEDEVEDVAQSTNEPIAIDAETVLATVDRDGNGVIDSTEVMVPQTANKQESITDIFATAPTPVTDEFPVSHDVAPTTDLFSGVGHDTALGRSDYDYSQHPISSYGANAYSSPSSFGGDYSSLLTDVKPDRISYDSYGIGAGKDNIMLDVARSMSELMRQNKEQRGVITQYQDKVESLESQARILSEKFKDQSARYEALSSKLRSLDEASGRLESRNQLLESRIRDQEKIIASQDRELKVLRPQVEGKQDLVRLLADARTLLGSDSSYGYNDGYSEGEGYYRRAA